MVLKVQLHLLRTQSLGLNGIFELLHEQAILLGVSVERLQSRPGEAERRLIWEKEVHEQ